MVEFVLHHSIAQAPAKCKDFGDIFCTSLVFAYSLPW